MSIRQRPSKKGVDIQKLVTDLGLGDTHAADAAGNSLIRAGLEAAQALLEAMAGSPTPIRRRAAFLLGELIGLSASTDNRIEHCLIEALGDEDWKVRRNAAMSLGKLGRRTPLAHLESQLVAELDANVRVSMILALGKLAGPEDAEWLDRLDLRTDKEKLAAKKASDRLRGLANRAGKVEVEAPVLEAARLELWCRDGVSDLVAEEILEQGLKAGIVTPGRVRVLGEVALARLLRVRTALYPVLVFETESSDPRIAGRQFSLSDVARELRRLTQGELAHYRLTLRDAIPGWPRRRDWMAEFASNCEGLLNAATGYSWEIIVCTEQHKLTMGARPASCRDARFDYRKADIPASIHPTLAAAAVRLLPGGGADIILDPFCGSGTLLAERAIRGPYGKLIGTDIEWSALQAARKNLDGFKRVSLIQTDATQFAIQSGVDGVCSNPPYGQRVGNTAQARAISRALDELAWKALRPGGVMVVFRPPGFPDPAGLTVLSRRRVDAGGIGVNLIVARKS
jgi:precorrin-6B methylase 2